MKTTIIKVLIIFACLSGWASAHAQSLRLFLRDSCPVVPAVKPVSADAKAIAALAAVLLEQVIAKGVDIASTALSAAARDRTTKVSGESSVASFYQMNEKGGLALNPEVACIVLLSPGIDQTRHPDWVKEKSDALAKIKLDGAPDFYLEVALEEKDAVIQATPRFLYLGKPLESSSWFRKAEKDYVVTLSLNEEATGKAFGSMVFSFGDVVADTPYASAQPDGMQTELKVLPNWPNANRVAKFPLPGEVNDAVSARKTRIADYLEANAILKRAALSTPPLVKQAIDTDQKYQEAVAALCARIDAVNRNSKSNDNAKAQAARVSDPRCPVDLWKASLEVENQSALAKRNVDTAWASAFFQRNCSQPNRFVDNSVDLKAGTLAYKSCKLPDFEDKFANLAGSFVTSAAVVETSEASAFLKTLASALADNKGKVTTALNDQLNPARREELAAQAATSERDARQKYQIALLKVAQLDASLQENSASPLSSRKLIEIQLAQAKIDANAAARAAGASVPFTDYD